MNTAAEEKNGNNFTLDESAKDVIGEVINISMGAAATVLSTILNKRVSITTPQVSLRQADDFSIQNFEPAMGIAIHYIEGLSGMNFLVMKQPDISSIVDIMMGGDGTNRELAVDEIFISAICEVMNQMMGSSATAMASFLDQTINISPPEAFMLEINKKNYQLNVNDDEEIVTIHFDLVVEGLLTSEFVSVMTMEFASSLVTKATSVQENSVQQVATQEPQRAPVQEQTYQEAPPAPAPPKGSDPAASLARPWAKPDGPWRVPTTS